MEKTKTATIVNYTGHQTVNVYTVFEYGGRKFFTHKYRGWWCVSHYPSGCNITYGNSTMNRAISSSKEKIDIVESSNQDDVDHHWLDGLPVINKGL